MESNYSIDVIHDADAKIFIGTSEDIPGLTVEEDSIHEFLETVMDIVPYLLEKKILKIKESENDAINVRILLEEPPETRRQINPIYSLNTKQCVKTSQYSHQAIE